MARAEFHLSHYLRQGGPGDETPFENGYGHFRGDGTRYLTHGSRRDENSPVEFPPRPVYFWEAAAAVAIAESEEVDTVEATQPELS